jgi:hypothetical protein
MGELSVGDLSHRSLRLIQVTHRGDDQRWRAVGEGVRPLDPPGTVLAAIGDGDPVPVACGWVPEPLLWVAEDVITIAPGIRIARGTPAENVIADLRDGPVELPGCSGRWRWRAVL